MAVVNIAFSSGLESVALLVKALRMGHTVNLCVINVAVNRETFLFEVVNTLKIKKICEEMGYKKYGKGYIKDIFILPRCPWSPSNKRAYQEFGSCKPWMLSNDVTQQLAVVLGMLDLRRWNLVPDYPGMWVGWLSQDSSEFSLSEIDHSSEDYMALLDLPKILGRVGMADRTCTPMRAPLWNMTKREVYETIPEELLPYVIHTGEGKVFASDKPGQNKIVYNVGDNKRDEWRASNMHVEMSEHWEYKLSDIPLDLRILAGAVTMNDFGLPSEAEHVVKNIADRFACAILGGSISLLEGLGNQLIQEVKDVVNMVNDLGVSYAKPVTKEQADQLIGEVAMSPADDEAQVVELIEEDVDTRQLGAVAEVKHHHIELEVFTLPAPVEPEDEH